MQESLGLLYVGSPKLFPAMLVDNVRLMHIVRETMMTPHEKLVGQCLPEFFTAL